jgi:hypothetical protein
MPYNNPDNQRLATSVSNAVDEAILMYEHGEVSVAVLLLTKLGFGPFEINRIFKDPEQRRKYINDVVSGF